MPHIEGEDTSADRISQLDQGLGGSHRSTRKGPQRPVIWVHFRPFWPLRGGGWVATGIRADRVGTALARTASKRTGERSRRVRAGPRTRPCARTYEARAFARRQLGGMGVHRHGNLPEPHDAPIRNPLRSTRRGLAARACLLSRKPALREHTRPRRSRPSRGVFLNHVLNHVFSDLLNDVSQPHVSLERPVSLELTIRSRGRGNRTRDRRSAARHSHRSRSPS